MRVGRRGSHFFYRPPFMDPPRPSEMNEPELWTVYRILGFLLPDLNFFSTPFFVVVNVVFFFLLQPKSACAIPVKTTLRLFHWFILLNQSIAFNFISWLSGLHTPCSLSGVHDKQLLRDLCSRFFIGLPFPNSSSRFLKQIWFFPLIPRGHYLHILLATCPFDTCHSSGIKGLEGMKSGVLATPLNSSGHLRSRIAGCPHFTNALLFYLPDQVEQCTITSRNHTKGTKKS